MLRVLSPFWALWVPSNRLCSRPSGMPRPLSAHGEPGPLPLFFQGYRHPGGGDAVDGGVFQKVRHHLLDQQRVHGHQEELLRKLHPDIDLQDSAAANLAHGAPR